jgi:hypothetical protein
VAFEEAWFIGSDADGIGAAVGLAGVVVGGVTDGLTGVLVAGAACSFF